MKRSGHTSALLVDQDGLIGPVDFEASRREFEPSTKDFWSEPWHLRPHLRRRRPVRRKLQVRSSSRRGGLSTTDPESERAPARSSRNLSQSSTCSIRAWSRTRIPPGAWRNARLWTSRSSQPLFELLRRHRNGSGHFLVAAIDQVESALSRFLTENPIPVNAELLALRRTHSISLGNWQPLRD